MFSNAKLRLSARLALLHQEYAIEKFLDLCLSHQKPTPCKLWEFTSCTICAFLRISCEAQTF